SGSRFDNEATIKRCHALLDTEQTQPRLRLLQGLSETAAVISHDATDRGRGKFDFYPDIVRLGMTLDVSQRLLHPSIYSQFSSLAQPLRRSAAENYRDASSLLTTLGGQLQCWQQPRSVQTESPELVRGSTQLLPALIEIA